MRTTVTLDDDLMADAATYSGVDDRSKLINLALDYYIKRMAAKRLAALGGTMPDLVVPARNSTRWADDLSPAKEAARSLVAMGGSMPDLEVPGRRRAEETTESGEARKVAEDPTDYKAGENKSDSSDRS